MATVLVLVGTEKGAFYLRSDESRTKWSVEDPFLKGWKVLDVNIDQRQNPPVMWAACSHASYGPAIHRSDDVGKTWRQIEHGPKYPDGSKSKLREIWTVVPGRGPDPNVLYAGVAEAGLFISRDGGEHWDELTGISQHYTREDWLPGAGGLCCHTILLHPTNPKRMWVGISSVGAFRSDDGGETWTIRNAGVENVFKGPTHNEVGCCVHRMVLDPSNPDRLFQQNHRGVYLSNDAGDTWQRIENGLPKTSQFGFPMVIDPNHADTLFIIPQESDEYRFAPDGALAVYKTTNAGATWVPRRNGLPENAYVGVLRQAMGVDGLNPCGVYFGTTNGHVYASRDAGETWNALPCQLPRISSVNVSILR